MAEVFPRGYVVVCDDIRKEIGQKPSFMGVYLDSIFIGTPFPTALQKLCFWVTYIDELSTPHGNATVRVYLPGDPDETPSAMAEIPIMELVEKSPKKTLTGRDAKKISTRLEFQFVPFQLKEAGLIRVSATYEGGEIELAKLDVSIGPDVVVPDQVAPAAPE